MSQFHIIVFGPLLGFLIAGLFAKQIGDRGAMAVTTGLVTLSAILSAFVLKDVAFDHNQYRILVLEWVRSGSLSFDWTLYIDSLTAVMLVVVNTVSALVHWYSIGYMSHDPHRARFFAYLSLFTFAMLMLVTSDNLVQMFFGWEGVGLASYLLIGFWFKKPSANAAAIKAFVVNRVGDFGFSLGIFALFLLTGSVIFEDIFQSLEGFADARFVFLGMDVHALTTIAVLLFVGAMGKSAQLFLHTWLPDAMEGPTPVSALIHAATMVTAGVFLMARMSPLLELAPGALTLIMIIGGATAFFAASVGLVQNDIKRVIAYSTCSQLGYMFVAIGASAYGAAIFHLFTHAFFKALLFLGAGSVIHAMSDEQDMRKMGGLSKMVPLTYLMMMVGTLALTGFPYTAGFFSKDMIIESAFATHNPAASFGFLMTVIAAFMTSFYSWRLVFMTFHGTPRADEKTLSHVHESPAVMWVPLAILAVGAVIAGVVFSDAFIGEGRLAFWAGSLVAGEGDVMDEAHHIASWIKWLPTGMMALGFALSFLFYIAKPGLPAAMARTFPAAYQFLLNKWYFDELYDRIFIRPAFWIGRFLWVRGDQKTIDGLGPDGIAAQVMAAARRVRVLQSGYVYHYAFAMLIGIALVITYFVLTGGGF
ncbi:NADH:ubiquinone oxidoreductase subunit L [Iodidimonas nitroreducens]|uniref:NADH:ubiquinone oxidoreductase subunit L n=1 Tax=Iodidimonas nitroreducens TaxID=1236968 RepID=A0A5A7N5U2_9PROT|nr:NADH-quinone oxidoreductase subunit L [Iodidimonas nitroreducens]GAK32918.1 NADH-quinone oxidoreductase subunit L [alpha proteobacterium Q-1]GER03084.1 NADH:ubiquinone oxidoreductase subunit L [Iodidimonas nitroreducens]